MTMLSWWSLRASVTAGSKVGKLPCLAILCASYPVDSRPKEKGDVFRDAGTESAAGREPLLPAPTYRRSQPQSVQKLRRSAGRISESATAWYQDQSQDR